MSQSSFLFLASLLTSASLLASDLPEYKCIDMEMHDAAIEDARADMPAVTFEEFTAAQQSHASVEDAFRALLTSYTQATIVGFEKSLLLRRLENGLAQQNDARSLKLVGKKHLDEIAKNDTEQGKVLAELMIAVVDLAHHMNKKKDSNTQGEALFPFLPPYEDKK